MAEGVNRGCFDPPITQSRSMISTHTHTRLRAGVEVVREGERGRRGGRERSLNARSKTDSLALCVGGGRYNSL